MYLSGVVDRSGFLVCAAPEDCLQTLHPCSPPPDLVYEKLRKTQVLAVDRANRVNPYTLVSFEPSSRFISKHRATQGCTQDLSPSVTRLGSHKIVSCVLRVGKTPGRPRSQAAAQQQPGEAEPPAKDPAAEPIEGGSDSDDEDGTEAAGSGDAAGAKTSSKTPEEKLVKV